MKNFLKSRVFGRTDRRSTKCKTVTCVSERRMNLSLHGVCGLGVLEETLAKRSEPPLILMHKSTGNFVEAQASTLTPKCVCISGKPDSLPAPAPSYFSVYVWRRRMRICDTDPKHEPVDTFYRRRLALCVATSTRCTRSVFSYVTVRG